MKNHKNGGFTLLEVLIALAVLSISMLAVYSLINNAVSITQYGKDRLFVIDKGYERILIHSHYPQVAVENTEDVNGTEINFTYGRTFTFLPGIEQVTLRVRSDSSQVSYEYFERVR